MRSLRVLAIFALPVMFLGCLHTGRTTDWPEEDCIDANSRGQICHDPDPPDFSGYEADETEGSYTPLHESETPDEVD